MELWVLYFCISIGLLLLSVAFKVAGKLRLTLPLAYLVFVGISPLFPDVYSWIGEHNTLMTWGFFILTGLCLLSWVVSFIRAIRNWRQSHREKESYETPQEDYASWQLRKAREMGIALEGLTFDKHNNLIDSRTGQPVHFRAGE